MTRTAEGPAATSRQRARTRRRLEGHEEITAALDRGAPVRLLLCREGDSSPPATALVERARVLGIEVLRESAREMRRMSASQGSPELLALEGPPVPHDLPSLMAADGLVLVLVGLRYPGNVGFILRSAEVAGAAGVLLAGGWLGSQRDEAMRIGIRADRFMPVLESDAAAALTAARVAGRRIVALETSGAKQPWEIDLRPATAVFVGGEALGLPEAILDAADDGLRVPTRGFMPSYNVQAAVGVVLGEWLRQIDASGSP